MNDSLVTVVGLGHALLGDDALGLAVVRELEQSFALPPSVTIVDAGSCGLDLVGYLLDSERLIFVDALLATAPPGTIRTVPYDELLAARPSGPRMSPHEPAIHDALSLLDLAGRGPREALLVGIVPDSMDVGVELSPRVSAAVPLALEEVVKHLRRFGVKLNRRSPADASGIRIELEGVVQGVGLRPWIHRTCRALGLSGSVANTPAGVTIEAFGARPELDALLASFEHGLPPAARVDQLRVVPLSTRAPSKFSIVESEAAGLNRPSIPADLAMCPACRREIDDPHDRRFGYAFTTCTDCGPRHSIVTGLPYDRARTSLAGFPLCAACTHEYADPDNRRFHAQALACPSCGPRLWLEAPLESVDTPLNTTPRDALAEVARRIIAGEIIAIQGLGGFHLACDATNERAVARLRARKKRDEKPFAVMVGSLELARALAELDEVTSAALVSAAHPIVLLRAGVSTIAANVAPGSSRLGLFLPYTPLHHLLLQKLGRPIVLTSGNESGEPIATTRDEARRTLRELADAFLFHDRPIVRRVEDSVVVVRAGQLNVLRRARGYAPRSIRLPAAAPEPILAVGGHLKSTACLVVDDRAYLTSHLGDLESYEAERAFRDDAEAFERLLGVRARVVAHDLHPEYASTRYAIERPACTRFGVQHHHAHVLARVAEQRIEGPVVAAVFDGSGFGSDGTAWGGEILQVDGLSWKRPFSIRPLALAGGERGIREPWRLALALLIDALGSEALTVAASLPLFAQVPSESRAVVTRMLRQGVNVLPVRGLGRYFDAFGALCLGRARASFEGQIAMAWEECAAPGSFAPYPFSMPKNASSDLRIDADNELDLRKTTRAVVADLLDGVSASVISARFHCTLVAAVAQLLELAGGRAATIVLAGGCFQNQRLETGLRDRLGAHSLCGPGEVPVNDGGLALGQAWAATLALRAGGLLQCA
ncbi:MAG TPA: carbamoyltransferase HypF [Polyangiaceae bacterium]